MRVKINYDICQGHGLCVSTAPELFAFGDDDMQPSVLLDPLPTELEELAQGAADCCPERAIIIE